MPVHEQQMTTLLHPVDHSLTGLIVIRPDSHPAARLVLTIPEVEDPVSQ